VKKGKHLNDTKGIASLETKVLAELHMADPYLNNFEEIHAAIFYLACHLPIQYAPCHPFERWH
jgi:hypothetical protein